MISLDDNRILFFWLIDFRKQNVSWLISEYAREERAKYISGAIFATDMGRLEHLERLALGRSAYQSQPPDNDEDIASTQGLPTSGNGLIQATQPRIQQYDSKGRPMNSEADVQNARLRHASNEVLALVGVVERKVQTDAKLHRTINLERIKRHRMHTREDERGNEWSGLIEVVAWFALWWPTALVRRIQIGLYSTDLPLSLIHI